MNIVRSFYICLVCIVAAQAHAENHSASRSGSDSVVACKKPSSDIAKALILMEEHLAVDVENKYFSKTASFTASPSETQDTGCIFRDISLFKTFDPEGSTRRALSFEESNISKFEPVWVQIARFANASDKFPKSLTERLEVTLTFKEPVFFENVTRPEQNGPTFSKKQSWTLILPEEFKSELEAAGFEVPKMSRRIRP